MGIFRVAAPRSAGSADPHGLEFHNGALISCDAGIHPGWPNYDSPSNGWIFKIEMAKEAV